MNYYAKQTQSNPTCSELVEPISNATLQKWAIARISYLCRGWFANKI